MSGFLRSTCYDWIMESLAYVPDWKVQSTEYTVGGNFTAYVISPYRVVWVVRIDPMGVWHFTGSDTTVPDHLEREAIMTAVGTYVIRRAFGGEGE